MKIVFTNDGRGNLRIHAPGCRDLARRHSEVTEEMDVKCLRDIVMNIYEGFEELEENPDAWVNFTGDISVMNCVGDLPDEV